MSTELIVLTDQPMRKALNSRNNIPLQELRVDRFCGPPSLDPRRCLSLIIGREGHMDQECILLTKAQATVLRDVLTENIVDWEGSKPLPLDKIYEIADSISVEEDAIERNENISYSDIARDGRWA